VSPFLRLVRREKRTRLRTEVELGFILEGCAVQCVGYGVHTTLRDTLSYGQCLLPWLAWTRGPEARIRITLFVSGNFMNFRLIGWRIGLCV
jgi:hypothetical protein